MNHAHFVIIICYAQTSNLCNPLTLRHVTGSAYMIVYVHAEPYTYVCITVYRTTCTVIMLFHHSRSTSPTSSLTHVVDFDQGHPPTPTTALHLLPSPAVKHPKDMLTDTAVKHPKDMLTDTAVKHPKDMLTDTAVKHPKDMLTDTAVKHPKDMLTDTAVKHPKDMLTDTAAKHPKDMLTDTAVKHPKDMLTDTAVKHPKDMLTDTGTGLYVFDVHPASLVEHVVSS